MTASRNVWCCTLRRNAALVALAALLALAFTAFRPPPSSGPFARDFEAYYAAGALFNAGGDPYSRRVWQVERTIPGVDAARDELLPFVGPAASLPLWSLLARLPQPVALRVWLALLAAAFAALVACALALARVPRDPRLMAAAFGFSFAASPAISSFALGQTALVSAAGIACALVFYRRRSAAGALGSTLLAALQPNLAVALVARVRSRWDVAVAAAAAALFGLAGLWASGFGFAAAYAGRLSAHYGAERFIAIQHTPAAIAYALGASEGAALAAGAAVAALAVAAAVAAIAGARLSPVTATLLAIALLPLALPFFHEHDFVVELLPLLVLAVRARGAARRAAAVASVLVLVDWFGLAQRVPAQAQILALGGAVVAAFAALTPRMRGEGGAALAGVAALVVLGAVCVPLARAHPAPVWPDALPAHFHAAPRADASGVWGDEQRAAGLARRDPVWGLLRALPLGGCCVLAGALLLDARRRRRERRIVTAANLHASAARPHPPRAATPV